MTDEILEWEATEIQADLNERTISVNLLPIGEEGRTNAGRLTVEAGAIQLPADPSVITLNLDHQRNQPVGRATSVKEQGTAILATFQIANTPEGDAALADAISPTGKRRKVSAEFDATIRAGRAIAGKLFGAALVPAGAFPSAMVLAADTPDEDLAVSATEDSITYTDLTADLDRVKAELEALTARITSPEAPASEVTDPEATPAEDNQEEPVMATATETPGQTPAPIAPVQVLANQAEPDVSLHEVFAAFAAVKNSGGSDAEQVLAALADIKTTGSGALPAAGVIPPTWVGKLWQGKRYQRKYIDLVTHTYGPIDISGRTGFRIDQGTALVAKRTGEKVELPTGTASTSLRSSTRESYGYAADVAQEWYYLAGGAEVIESFWLGVADSYAKITDEDALKTLFTVASRGDGAALSKRVSPAGLPAGTPANSQYYPAVQMLIQAIEAVSDANDDPAWAVVNPVAWSQLLYTPRELLPEFVSLNVTAGTGQATVDGKVNVVKAPNAFFTGLSNTAPQVIAGAKSAVEFKELGETPIQLDALNVAKFGVDRSTVGFLETFIVNPEATVLIGTV